eukprot:5191278-Amphidinium_carterae.2
MVASTAIVRDCESDGAHQCQDNRQGGRGRDISHCRGRGDGKGTGPLSEHLVHHSRNMPAHESVEESPRGNCSEKWWTCRECCKRWQRTPLTDHSRPLGSEKMTVGRYKGTETLSSGLQRFAAWASQTEQTQAVQSTWQVAVMDMDLDPEREQIPVPGWELTHSQQ